MFKKPNASLVSNYELNNGRYNNFIIVNYIINLITVETQLTIILLSVIRKKKKNVIYFYYRVYKNSLAYPTYAINTIT